MTVKNSQGKIYYGMHFYPGVAEYGEPGKDPYRVYLNEDTLRSMDPTFAGRPVFVRHVDEVNQNIDQLRSEADGWVIESFFNSADGKHWVKFIIVSEKGERALKNGYRLSNAYLPKSFGRGGFWNGVEYTKEILGGEFEHLALVEDPRYEESVIMTPEKFKEYNDEKVVELKRLANSKQKEKSKMGFEIFKRVKHENSKELAGMSILLPKTGKEKTIEQLINEADEHEEKKMGNEGLADPSHKVKLHDGSYCNVADLVDKHKSLSDELEEMKKKKEDEMEKESDLETKEKDVDSESDVNNEEEEMNEDEEKKENDEEDKDAKKKALELAAHEDKEMKEEKKKNELEKKRAAKEKADRLRNAQSRSMNDGEGEATVELMSDRVARGRARYGSSQ